MVFLSNVKLGWDLRIWKEDYRGADKLSLTMNVFLDPLVVEICRMPVGNRFVNLDAVLQFLFTIDAVLFRPFGDFSFFTYFY